MVSTDELIKAVICNYDIGNITLQRFVVGRGENYLVMLSGNPCYFLKIFDVGDKNINLSDEIDVCKLLNECGIKSSIFIKNIFGYYISTVDSTKIMTLQKYIHGTPWRVNTAPDWLMYESVTLLHKIQKAISHLKLKASHRVFSINDNTKHLEHLKVYLENSNLKHIELIRQYLDDKIQYLLECPAVDINKLTLINSHGDFHIGQLFTNQTSISHIVDLSETSKLSAVLEFIRFYEQSSPECVAYEINIKKFKYIMKAYLELCPLNEYDLHIMFDLRLRQIAKAQYG